MFVFVIRNVRKKKNITLYRLYKLTGLSYSYLSELENNKVFNPSLATMYKIANALEVEEKELFDFGHIQNRKELITLLNDTINNASDSELMYLYKVISALKYLKP